MSPPCSPPSMDMDAAGLSRDQGSSSPEQGNASVVGTGLHTPPQPQHQEDSGSDLELDSPPRITFIYKPEDQEPGSPTSPLRSPISINGSHTSPPGSPLSIDMELAGISPYWPPSPSPCTSVHTPAKPQHQEELGWESELEVHSPRLISIPQTEDQELRSPSYLPGSPPTVDVKPLGLPKGSTYDEENRSFKSLVDDISIATEDVCKSISSCADIDYKSLHQRRIVLYAENALKHYNSIENNKIKYELISGITSCDMIDRSGCFGHVNFTAKGNQQNSKEELFFAELRWEGDGTFVPTCVLSLEGIKRVGGLRDSVYDKFYEVWPIDNQHCYGCCRRLRHPKNGELYKMGHVASSMYYHG